MTLKIEKIRTLSKFDITQSDTFSKDSTLFLIHYYICILGKHKYQSLKYTDNTYIFKQENDSIDLNIFSSALRIATSAFLTCLFLSLCAKTAPPLNYRRFFLTAYLLTSIAHKSSLPPFNQPAQVTVKNIKNTFASLTFIFKKIFKTNLQVHYSSFNSQRLFSLVPLYSFENS